MLRFVIVAVALLNSGCILAARQVYQEYRQNQDRSALADDGGVAVNPSALSPGVRVVRDVSYGGDAKFRFDVYAPAQANNAPVIFMVHGGAWRFGDKSASGVVANKVNRWVSRGFVFVSANYRMLPGTAVSDQAQDIAHAFAEAQARAGEWGGDRSKFILMGHSAGAHLVALVSASPNLAKDAGAAPWLGSVFLDSAALDVTKIMEKRRHFPLYDNAFGSDPAYWRSLSPTLVLTQSIPPVLAICSSRRADSCDQADEFVHRAVSFGASASVLRENLSHGQINMTLGLPGPYTDAVENFMRSLDPAVAALL